MLALTEKACGIHTVDASEQEEKGRFAGGTSNSPRDPGHAGRLHASVSPVRGTPLQEDGIQTDTYTRLTPGPEESSSTRSTPVGGGVGLGAACCVMTHGGGGGVCVRERPPIKVECLAPGAVGRERAPAPSRAAAPAALCRAPLPVSPRGKALGFSLIPPSQTGATGERPEGAMGEGPEGGVVWATASGKPEGVS